MALGKAALKAAIINAFVTANAETDPSKKVDAWTQWAEDVSTAMVTFVESGTVNTAGLADDNGDVLLLNTTVT